MFPTSRWMHDPNTPYALFYADSWTLSVGGTSAVAPNMAALYAQVDQYYGHRLGLAATGLYHGFVARTYPGKAWHDILSGSNGDYSAHSGYDNVTGVGSLNGYYLHAANSRRLARPYTSNVVARIHSRVL